MPAYSGLNLLLARIINNEAHECRHDDYAWIIKKQSPQPCVTKSCRDWQYAYRHFANHMI